MFLSPAPSECLVWLPTYNQIIVGELSAKLVAKRQAGTENGMANTFDIKFFYNYFHTIKAIYLLDYFEVRH